VKPSLKNKERKGKEIYNHACSPGCIIQCSNTVLDEKGDEITSCLEYESAWALGADCGIDNLEDVAKMNALCNDYGLDTIETGVAIAVAMEGGLIPFGDSKAAIELVHEMGKGQRKVASWAPGQQQPVAHTVCAAFPW